MFYGSIKKFLTNNSEYGNMDIFSSQQTGILDRFQSSVRKTPLGSRFRVTVPGPTYLYVAAGLRLLHLRSKMGNQAVLSFKFIVSLLW